MYIDFDDLKHLPVPESGGNSVIKEMYEVAKIDICRRIEALKRITKRKIYVKIINSNITEKDITFTFNLEIGEKLNET